MKKQCDNFSVKGTEACISDRCPANQSGNTESFSGLYDCYVNMLFNFGCKITSDRELVKDCIHDVFVKLYYKQEEMSNVQNIKSYLFVSLKNKICDELRKKNYYSDKELEDYQYVSDQNAEDDFILGEKEALSSRVLKRLMSELSGRERQAITLYYLENKKYEDISLLMGINYQSLRNLIYRGLTRLRSIAVEKSFQLQ
jgi:RNA polymerase sigma factor (sigma-70 family)